MAARYAIRLCDADPEIRAAMRRSLNRFHVTEAGTPAEALAVLRVARFDAVVSDFSLGTSADGLDLLQTVRVDSRQRTYQRRLAVVNVASGTDDEHSVILIGGPPAQCVPLLTHAEASAKLVGGSGWGPAVPAIFKIVAS